MDFYIRKKNLVITIMIIILIISLNIIVFANEKNQSTILTGEKVKLMSDSAINGTKFAKSHIDRSIDMMKINNILVDDLTVDIIGEKNFDVDELSINLYKDIINSKDIIKLSNEDFALEIDNESGKLIAYQSKKQSFSKCTLDKADISLLATEIFNNLNIENKEQYKLTFIEQFDSEIWRAGFAKEYNNLINNGESIKFSFAPQTNEIVTLAINDTPYANNDILLSEDTAKKIAKDIFSDTIKGLEPNITIEIVLPNYEYYKADLASNEVYAKINTMRKAYVCKFPNEYQSKVYVDCSTGEVLGGSSIL